MSATALGALVLVILTGWAWGRGGASPQRVTAAPVWADVLDGLDASRAAAFARADPPGLSAVYATGTAALRTDTGVLTGLGAARETARGVRHHVVALTVQQSSAQVVHLQVREQLGAYELLDSQGRVVARRPAGSLQTHRIVLRATGSGWRVVSVAAA